MTAALANPKVERCLVVFRTFSASEVNPYTWAFAQAITFRAFGAVDELLNQSLLKFIGHLPAKLTHVFWKRLFDEQH